MFFIRVLFFCLVLAGTVEAAPLRVALLLESDEPSPWTDMLRNGLANTPVAGDVIIARPGEDQTGIFRKAAQEHDLVIVASDGLHEILRDNAASFRRVMFGSVDAGIRAPNIMSVTFADEQAAFLAGAAAAAMARDRGAPVIGWLSGADTPAMRSLFSGYSEGALLEVPEARVIQAVAGSFNAPATAAEKTAWLADAGAKVIALAAGAGNAAAAEAAKARNVPFMVVDGPAVGATLSRSADRAIAEIINSAASGNFRGKEIITYDLSNGGVGFNGLERLAGKSAASRDILRRSQELANEIRKGAIRLHSLRQRTLCDCLD